MSIIESWRTCYFQCLLVTASACKCPQCLVILWKLIWYKVQLCGIHCLLNYRIPGNFRIAKFLRFHEFLLSREIKFRKIIAMPHLLYCTHGSFAKIFFANFYFAKISRYTVRILEIVYALCCSDSYHCMSIVYSKVDQLVENISLPSDVVSAAQQIQPVQ